MPSDTQAFAALLARMTDAICRGDGAAAAACFTPDGAYHDGFYGEFAGREAIARMVTGLFHGNARDFVWEIDEPCAADGLGYAHYRFSYTATLAGAEGRRVCFEGIARCRLAGGLIAHYSEVFDRGVALAQLGFAPERIARSAAKAAAAQRAGAGAAHRLAPR